MVTKQRGKAVQKQARSKNVKRGQHFEEETDDEGAQGQRQKLKKKARVKAITESEDSGSDNEGSDSGSESTSRDLNFVLFDYF